MFFCYFNSTFDTQKYSDNSRLRIFNGDMLEKYVHLLAKVKKRFLKKRNIQLKFKVMKTQLRKNWFKKYSKNKVKLLS